MPSAFFTELKRQANQNFTGRVNYLDSSSQLIGYILFASGNMKECTCGALKNYEAIEALYIIFNHKEHTRVIVEPETINEPVMDFTLPLHELEQLVTKNNPNMKKLSRPAPNIILKVNPNFLIEGKNLSKKEFDTLCLLSDNNNVKKLYQKSNLPEIVLTYFLTKLKMKNALNVFVEEK